MHCTPCTVGAGGVDGFRNDVLYRTAIIIISTKRQYKTTATRQSQRFRIAFHSSIYIYLQDLHYY